MKYVGNFVKISQPIPEISDRKVLTPDLVATVTLIHWP